MEKLAKMVAWFKGFWAKLVEAHKRGAQWVGTDGLINMETSTILTVFLMIFFPTMWAMIFSAFIVIGKSAFDKSNGHKKEGHDLICAMVGVLLGALLGTAQTAITLFS